MPCFKPSVLNCNKSRRARRCQTATLREWQQRIRSGLPRAWQRRFVSTATDRGGSDGERLFASCAVVGSAPGLLNTRLGDRIDSAEAIIRVNAAPTAGYEAFAGTRTTLRLWGALTWEGIDSGRVWGVRPASLPASRGELDVIRCPEKTRACKCWAQLGNASWPAHARVGASVWERARAEMRAAALASDNYSRGWKHTIDRATQHEWRVLYHEQVCSWLVVGPEFDWRRAAVVATTRESAVEALCVWNNAVVSVVVPWQDEGTMDAPLRRGVVRLIHKGGIEFVYDDAFKLRGTVRSCLQRHAPPCLNCSTRSKRRCLNVQYDYYLRQMDLDLVKLDECLGLHLKASRKKNEIYRDLLW